MEISEVMTQNENSIHVFGVIGIEKKVNYDKTKDARHPARSPVNDI